MLLLYNLDCSHIGVGVLREGLSFRAAVGGVRQEGLRAPGTSQTFKSR
jgi:hypothetical protein